jgi:hypothetical protein
MPRLTPSGKKTALADVEDKLKREYPGNSKAVYGTLNKEGLMYGNKATAKGAKAAKTKASPAIRGSAKPTGSTQDRQK